MDSPETNSSRNSNSLRIFWTDLVQPSLMYFVNSRVPCTHTLLIGAILSKVKVIRHVVHGSGCTIPQCGGPRRPGRHHAARPSRAYVTWREAAQLRDRPGGAWPMQSRNPTAHISQLACHTNVFNLFTVTLRPMTDRLLMGEIFAHVHPHGGERHEFSRVFDLNYSTSPKLLCIKSLHPHIRYV